MVGKTKKNGLSYPVGKKRNKPHGGDLRRRKSPSQGRVSRVKREASKPQTTRGKGESAK